jgi:hypothetical protein
MKLRTLRIASDFVRASSFSFARLCDAVRVPVKSADYSRGIRRDDYWNNACAMATAVEILEIKRVVRDLIEGGRRMGLATGFEFDNEYGAASERHDVCALSHAGDGIFQRNPGRPNDL